MNGYPVELGNEIKSKVSNKLKDSGVTYRFAEKLMNTDPPHEDLINRVSENELEAFNRVLKFLEKNQLKWTLSTLKDEAFFQKDDNAGVAITKDEFMSNDLLINIKDLI